MKGKGDMSNKTLFRDLNGKIRDDPRVDLSMIPIGDGLMLARKR
jgi:predicted O-methyltransferase YrrM